MSIGYRGPVVPRLAAAIQQVRARLGMTTSKFAESLGVSQSTVSRYESGERTPRFSVIGALLKLANEFEKREIIGTLLDAGLIGASPRLMPSEIIDYMAIGAGKTRIHEALMDLLAEKRQDEGFRKFVVGVADVIDECITVDESVVTMLHLWAAHSHDPRTAEYFRDALGFLRARLWINP